MSSTQMASGLFTVFKRQAVTCAALLLASTFAVAQAPIYSMQGLSAGDQFGKTVAALGDIDGDGAEDIAVGAPLADVGGTDRGAVVVFSGASGASLYSVYGQSNSDNFGCAIARLGDVNLDGVADFAVGARLSDLGGTNSGALVVCSGATGAKLKTISGLGAGDQLGYAIAEGSDFDGDGLQDVAAGAPFRDAGGSNAGSVLVFTALTGALIGQSNGQHALDEYGSALCTGPDLNADGKRDLYVGAPKADQGGNNSGSVLAVTSNGVVLMVLDGQGVGQQFGRAVAFGGQNLFGNWYGCIAVGAPFADYAGTDSGSTWVYETTGAVRFRVDGQGPGEQFGTSLAIADWVPGNASYQHGDHGWVVVGAPLAQAGGQLLGRIDAVSKTDGGLCFSRSGATLAGLHGQSVCVAQRTWLDPWTGDSYVQLSDILAGSPGNNVASPGTVLADRWVTPYADGGPGCIAEAGAIHRINFKGFDPGANATVTFRISGDQASASGVVQGSYFDGYMDVYVPQLCGEPDYYQSYDAVQYFGESRAKGYWCGELGIDHCGPVRSPRLTASQVQFPTAGGSTELSLDCGTLVPGEFIARLGDTAQHTGDDLTILGYGINSVIVEIPPAQAGSSSEIYVLHQCGWSSSPFYPVSITFTPTPPSTYCIAKPNSLACTPSIASTGSPSATQSSGFVVTCGQVRNQKLGVLIYSVAGSGSTPFQGGTLCVGLPLRRAPGVNSGGSALPAADCTGVYSIDMNSLASGTLTGSPVPELQQLGASVYCQWWGRDPGDAFGTTLSNGLLYTVDNY